MKKNKGITLIALIITIVVMLILVAVSVNVLIKSNLIGTAERTVDKYKTASEEEAKGGAIEINGKKYDSIEDYIKEKEGISNIHNWQYVNENTREEIRCTCEQCKAFEDGDSTGRTLKIGQQIGKTEYKTASTSISKEKSGYSSDQTINLNNEETKWVVFGYEDKDKDGLNEVLLLTTEHPTKTMIALYGAEGYNNCIEEINRMCRELYGTNARGMTIEDVNNCLGYTPGNLTTKLKDLGDTWTAIKNYNLNSKSGVFYDPSNPEGIKDNGATLGEYELNGYKYGTGDISSNISNTAKAMIFGNKYNNYCFWLASRGVDVQGNSVGFGARRVNEGSAGPIMRGLLSEGNSSLGLTGLGARVSIRAILSLTSEIPVGGEVLEFTGRFSEIGEDL
jgi:hypothetical protein